MGERERILTYFCKFKNYSGNHRNVPQLFRKNSQTIARPFAAAIS